MNPLGKNGIGVTVWAMPGRAPGQRTRVQHLTWGRPGDAIHLHTDGLAEDRTEYPGRDTGTVTGPCHSAAKAQQAVDAYIAGRQQQPAAAHRLARTEFPHPPQPGPPIHAGEAPAIAQGADDETARILAEHGTPEKRLDYALMEAGRHKREAYTAGQAQRKADGDTPAAKERYDAAYEAAHAGWTAEVACVVAEYARELGTTAPASTDDPASPYNQGLCDGADMLMSAFADRRSGYDGGRWREYVAGFAQNAVWHAEATSWYARAVMKTPRETPPEPSAARQPILAPEPTPAGSPGSGQRNNMTAPSVSPDPEEMAAAYRAVHGRDAPWLMHKAWEAGQLSTATGSVRTAPWYLAAIAAKRDGQPMSAVPRYIAAARMDAAAGRLRDHRDPLDSSDDARDVADALGDAAAAMRTGDLTGARSAINRARSTITPSSSLHRILNEHETPAINLASPARFSGPASSPARLTRRPSQPVRRQARGRSR